MVALAHPNLKSFRDEQTRERAELDQMLATLVKREITNEDADPVSVVRNRVIYTEQSR